MAAAMPLTAQEVRHVATLARLGLSDDEVASFGVQLDAILDHISQLNSIDVSGVAETAQIGGLVNAWREDVARPSLPAAVALSNAPEREGNFFQVGAIQE